MIAKNNYYYKPSKVKGQVYMQIWKKENGKDIYVISLGSAAGCLKKFQDLQKLVNELHQSAQTKTLNKNQTKNSIVEIEDFD